MNKPEKNYDQMIMGLKRECGGESLEDQIEIN